MNTRSVPPLASPEAEVAAFRPETLLATQWEQALHFSDACPDGVILTESDFGELMPAPEDWV